LNTILNRFFKIANENPDSICIIDNNKTYTYNQIYLEVNILSNQLKNQTIDLNKPIVLDFTKSKNYIVSILSIWNIGGYFLPIEGSNPKLRKEEIIKHSEAEIILNENIVKELIDNSLSKHKIKKKSETYLKNIAYIIYTSGSTGLPNGVLVSHNGILDVINDQINIFELNNYSKMLAYLSISFDASLSEIFTTILSGATLVIFDHISKDSHKKLLDVIRENQISHICLPPAIISLFNPSMVPISLKAIITGGEVIALDLIQKWSDKLLFIIAYGPTETTICTHIHIGDTNQKQEGILGKAIGKVVIKLLPILDEPDVYELCLGGDAVSIGYLKNDILNNEKFFVENGIRFFKSGDLVKKNYTNLIYLGRKDNQLKIRGYRIFPEEIQKKIQNLKIIENIRIEIVVKNERPKIFCIYTNQKYITPLEIRNKIKKFLPIYLIPNYYLEWLQVPINENGKLDVKYLINYPINREHLPLNNYIKPEKGIELTIVSIWSKFFPNILIGLNDSFVELGGDSLEFLEFLYMMEMNGINLLSNMIFMTDSIKVIDQKINNGDYFEKNKITKFDSFSEKNKILKLNNKSIDKKLILITGGNGYLGNYFIQTLDRLRSKESVLVKSTGKLFTKKLRKILENIQVLSINREEVNNNQISNLVKNITLNELKDINILPEKIIHFASNINIFLDSNDLISDNFEYLQKIFKMKQFYQSLSFHYISTLGILVHSNFEGIFFPKKIDDTISPYKGYSYSKFIAEMFLESQKLSTKNKIFIHRFSLLGPDINYNSETDLFFLFLQGIAKTKIVPDLRDSFKLNYLPLSILIYPLLNNIFLNSETEYFHYSANYFIEWKLFKELIKNINGFSVVSNQNYLDFISQFEKNKTIDTHRSIHFILNYFSSLIKSTNHRNLILIEKDIYFYNKQDFLFSIEDSLSYLKDLLLSFG
jgi:acyl-CoA synthetase (AMP-forming)/AMP-acid ligase II/nucleoside-diphosphate-sugar epimerase